VYVPATLVGLMPTTAIHVYIGAYAPSVGELTAPGGAGMHAMMMAGAVESWRRLWSPQHMNMALQMLMMAWLPAVMFQCDGDQMHHHTMVALLMSRQACWTVMRSHFLCQVHCCMLAPTQTDLEACVNALELRLHQKASRAAAFQVEQQAFQA